MTTTSQPATPPGLCRTCSTSRTACDALRRDRRGEPCCGDCDHADEPVELGVGSEDW